MNTLRRFLQWLLWIVRAAVFLALLAFALNNRQEATLHLMFGRQWRAPMTLIVLAAFALGLVVGVLGMLPGWRRRYTKMPVSIQPSTLRATGQLAADSTPTAREF
jgi:uncharacterized integral membrane protein